MNKFKRKGWIIAAVFIFSSYYHAQAQEFGQILAAGADDANQYFEEFLTPGINSLGVGLAGGWYNTAKPHKIAGLDITGSINIATIPDAEKMFNFNEQNFSQFLLRGNGGDDMVPTLVGGSPVSGSEIYIEADQTIVYPEGSITIENEITFDTPSGFDLDDIPVATGMPTPTLNLGVGLIKNTELKFRYLPQQTYNDSKFDLIGFGVMHDVKQWIPVIKNLPFDLSAFFGTTRLSAESNVELDYESTDPSTGTRTSVSGTGKAVFESTATTIQAIVSKKLLFFTPYASVGYNIINTNFDLTGDYTFKAENSTAGKDESITVSDPIAMEFNDAGGARMTVGARVKLLILTIHADYTLQKYNTFTAGIGLSIR